MSLPILLHVTTSANQRGITIITIATHVGITRVTVINSVYLSVCLPEQVTEVGRKSKSKVSEVGFSYILSSKILLTMQMLLNFTKLAL